MSAFRSLLMLLVFLAATACGESGETEETTTPETTVEEPEETVDTEPEVHGCGDGVVDEGEVCDDGGANCPDGWGLCLRCVYCEGWVLRERSIVPDPLHEPPLPSPPFCTQTVQDTGARRPRSARVNTYDDHGRLTEETLDDDPAIGTQRSVYEYDDDGNRVGVVRTVGDQTLYTDRYHVVDGRRMASRRDADGDGTADVEQRFTYDDHGRMTVAETRGGGRDQFHYNDFGHLTSAETRSGNSVQIERDDRGRMIHRTQSDGIPYAYRRSTTGLLQVELPEWATRHDRWNHTYEGDRLTLSVYHSDPDTIAQSCAITTDDRGRVTVRACDTDNDDEVDRTTTYDYACIDALRDSLPRTDTEVADEPEAQEPEADAEEADSDDSDDSDSDDSDD